MPAPLNSTVLDTLVKRVTREVTIESSPDYPRKWYVLFDGVILAEEKFEGQAEDRAGRARRILEKGVHDAIATIVGK